MLTSMSMLKSVYDTNIKKAKRKNRVKTDYCRSFATNHKLNEPQINKRFCNNPLELMLSAHFQLHARRRIHQQQCHRSRW